MTKEICLAENGTPQKVKAEHNCLYKCAVEEVCCDEYAIIVSAPTTCSTEDQQERVEVKKGTLRLGYNTI